MRNKKVMSKEFQELEVAIVRLQRAEKELDHLKSPEDIFVSQIESIRGKLKQPSMVQVVEKELNELKKQVESYRVQVAGYTREYEESIELSDAYSTSPFPRELDSLYANPVFIGSGGFARVFRVQRRTDDMEVAVKVPDKLDASTGKNFVREIYSWQLLGHANVVRLYDANILPMPYIEMELCEISLDELHKPMDIELAMSIVFHSAEGLKHAHSKGMIHRDLKPHNILLKYGVPKISDWGLSKISAESKISALHAFSPRYAAPEQISPQQYGNPDHRTDIYQLGSILYELLTGELPFKADNVTELMAHIINSEPVAISLLNPATRKAEPIVMKCLRKNMDERYQSVDDMQKDLSKYLEKELKRSLTKSQGDVKRLAYCNAELCLIHLRQGDLDEALQYAVDLTQCLDPEIHSDLMDVTREIEHCYKESMTISEELLERAIQTFHQVKNMQW